MKEKERLIVGGLVALMLVLWLGFPFHQSPRFAGSLLGGMIGVAGALLMVVPLAYMIVKRNKRLKKYCSQWVSMRTLLAWHIYAGVLGPLLVVIHSGHKYESPLGIALTGMTLLVVVSGFVGRYLMSRFSQEIREKKKMLATLQTSFQAASGELAVHLDRVEQLQPYTGFVTRLLAGLFVRDSKTPLAAERRTIPSAATLLRLSESIADVEYAIKSHEHFKTWFGKWLKFHIWISGVLYVLMALHIWAAIHFGLRWFEPSAESHFVSTTAVATSGGPRRDVSPAPNALADFSQNFGELFARHWRPATAIHGIETTVFDYAGIAREIWQPDSSFSKTVDALRRVNTDSLTGDDVEKAFWINVYNFAAMKLAAENYPVPSIIDARISADDPWGVPAVSIGGTSYSLKEIENAILLKKFEDPRIVFAISCAAVSCPDRANEIFDGDRIDGQLDQIIRQFFRNSDKGLEIDVDRNTVTLSWILKADQRLFGGNQEGVLRFVSRYAAADVAKWIDQHLAETTVVYFKHDWGLNDIALADDGVGE
jgi:Protein of unknown function, DUF547